MVATKAFFGAVLFLFFFSYFLSEITGTTYNLISPITLTAISTALIVVIGASSSPLVKGIAMAGLFTAITASFIFSGLDIMIQGLVIVPVIMLLGMAMSQIGQA